MDISKLSATSLNSAISLVTTALFKLWPSYDWTTGSMVNELNARPTAAALSAASDTIETFQDNMTLGRMATNGASLSQLEDIASNFRLTPATGSPGSGVLTLVVGSSANVYISAGTTFTAGGLTLVCSTLQVGTLSAASAAGSNSSLMRKTSAGYAFTIPVETASNTSSTVAAGTIAYPNATISGLISATVSSAVTGGTDDESSADFLTRVASGPTAQVPSGASHIAALLKAKGPVIPRDIAVFGLGDVECEGGSDNALGIKTGGYLDVVCRVATLPSTLTLTGTLVASDDSNYAAMILLHAGDLAGAYSIDTVNAVAPAAVIWGPSNKERYTAAQTAKIYVSSGKVGASVAVEATGFNGILDLQDFFSGTTASNPAQVVTVKAPAPFRVSAVLQVLLSSSLYPDLTASDVVSVVSNALSSIPLNSDAIRADSIVRAIEAAWPEAVVDFPIQLYGKLTTYSGEVLSAASVDGKLNIPSSGRTTNRNTAVICLPSDVSAILKRTA